MCGRTCVIHLRTVRKQTCVRQAQQRQGEAVDRLPVALPCLPADPLVYPRFERRDARGPVVLSGRLTVGSPLSLLASFVALLGPLLGACGALFLAHVDGSYCAQVETVALLHCDAEGLRDLVGLP